MGALSQTERKGVRKCLGVLIILTVLRVTGIQIFFHLEQGFVRLCLASAVQAMGSGARLYTPPIHRQGYRSKGYCSSSQVCKSHERGQKEIG